MIKRGKFLALISGGMLGSAVPAALEAKEEFVAQGVGDITFHQQKPGHATTKPIFPVYESTGVTAALSWSQDGHLWLIHSDGRQKKLI